MVPLVKGFPVNLSSVSEGRSFKTFNDVHCACVCGRNEEITYDSSSSFWYEAKVQQGPSLTYVIEGVIIDGETL